MVIKNKSEEFMRRTLINYWIEEDRKYRIREDTTNSCPEICMNLRELYSEKPLSDFHIETYNALED